MIPVTCVTYVQKDFQIWTWIKQKQNFIDKISIFQEIVPNFTYSQKSYFKSIIGTV